MTNPARLLLILTAVLAFAITAPASASTWQYFDFDADEFYDAAAIDRDGSGTFEDIRYDLDNDGVFDTRIYNTYGSESLLEVADYDMDENGLVEMRLVDGDQRVGFDYLYADRDRDGAWDWFRGGARRIVPGSNIDAITRTRRYNAGQRLIHDFRMRTGTSLLYPSFPACC